MRATNLPASSWSSGGWLRILPAPQAPIHHRGDEAARQERHQLVVRARNHDAAPAHQPVVALPRDVRGRAVEAARVMYVHDSRARLEFRRHRAGTERGDADALGLEFTPQTFAERDYVGLAGIVDRHAGAGDEAGDRRDIENAAAMARKTVDEAQR